MIFFVGLHMPNHAHAFEHCMVSVNRLIDRRSSFPARKWLMDSGAFTTVTKHGYYPTPVEGYATEIVRWSDVGTLLAAASQDYMCEEFVLRKTGLSVAEHQRLTIDRYCALRRLVPYRIPILPVLQGYRPQEYADHVRQYGELLAPGQWVGVGSVCKRNAKPESVVAVLRAIQAVRPDLRLHGFGLKVTALQNPDVTNRLYSADSMAWSWAARWEGRDANDINEAIQYAQKVNDKVLVAKREPQYSLAEWEQ